MDKAVMKKILFTVFITEVLLAFTGCGDGLKEPTESPPNVVTVPTQLNFFTKPGVNPPDEQLMIGVANRISAKWSARVDESWLKVEPSSGETPRNFTGALMMNETTVSVESSHMIKGTYDTFIYISVEGNEAEKLPIRLNITDIEPGYIFDVRVEQGNGTAWEAGMKLGADKKVYAGVLTDNLFTPHPRSSFLVYYVGDMVVKMEGTLVNESNNEWQVDFWPQAFDISGIEVAWGLDMGGAPLTGHLQVNIPAHSSYNFTLHLSWAENIERITIGANKYDPAIPLP
jgi:hypothetical protein